MMVAGLKREATAERGATEGCPPVRVAGIKREATALRDPFACTVNSDPIKQTTESRQEDNTLLGRYKSGPKDA